MVGYFSIRFIKRIDKIEEKQDKLIVDIAILFDRSPKGIPNDRERERVENKLKNDEQ